MADPLATAIAFAALGSNVLATALLLLFNPRSRAVRWFAAFLTAISLWLLSAGMLAIAGEWVMEWAVPFVVAVMLMPVLFLASMLVEARAGPRWLPWAVTGAGLLLLPLVVRTMLGHGPGAGWLVVAWQATGWGGGALVNWLLDPPHKRASRPRWAHRLINGFLVIPPVAVVVGVAMGAQAFFTYVMPLLVIAIHVALFFGVVWLRFYDIEVRAARSGDIAGRMGEAERLAAVGELSATIAHEVRNPLTGVRSLAQRMAEEDLDPERWRRYAGVIVEEVSRVERIVASMLAVARRRPAAATGTGPTPLGPLFDDLILLTAARAERAGVAVRTEGGDIVAAAPREPLAQASLNLLLNAIRHSPPGGVVRLGAERVEGAARGEGAERGAGVERGEGVDLWVRDSGPGVPAADRERIFEPFYSGTTEGTGLGLSVVRSLAREHGWAVTVADAPGGGAEFRVRIPDRRPAGDAADAVDAANAAPTPTAGPPATATEAAAS
jgi:signal transduction histidine kinase